MQRLTKLLEEASVATVCEVVRIDGFVRHRLRGILSARSCRPERMALAQCQAAHDRFAAPRESSATALPYGLRACGIWSHRSSANFPEARTCLIRPSMNFKAPSVERVVPSCTGFHAAHLTRHAIRESLGLPYRGLDCSGQWL